MGLQGIDLIKSGVMAPVPAGREALIAHTLEQIRRVRAKIEAENPLVFARVRRAAQQKIAQKQGRRA